MRGGGVGGLRQRFGGDAGQQAGGALEHEEAVAVEVCRGGGEGEEESEEADVVASVDDAVPEGRGKVRVGVGGVRGGTCDGEEVFEEGEAELDDVGVVGGAGEGGGGEQRGEPGHEDVEGEGVEGGVEQGVVVSEACRPRGGVEVSGQGHRQAGEQLEDGIEHVAVVAVGGEEGEEGGGGGVPLAQAEVGGLEGGVVAAEEDLEGAEAVEGGGQGGVVAGGGGGGGEPAAEGLGGGEELGLFTVVEGHGGGGIDRGGGEGQG